MFKKDKITIYYFGSANDTEYKANVTTKKTFRKWKEKGDKKTCDIAFIWEGVHPNIKGWERQAYIYTHNVVELNKFLI